jgi:hypothetical protein
VTARERLGTGGAIGEDERCDYTLLAIGTQLPYQSDILFPFASAGAIEGHSEQSFDEQGMSCRR